MQNQLPAVLKGLREQKGLTQRELANLLNISQRAYSHYETGESEPKTDGLILLADFYNLPIDVLVGRYTIPNMPQPTETKKRKPRKRNPLQEDCNPYSEIAQEIEPKTE